MLLLQQVCFVKGNVLLQLYLFSAPGGVTEVAPESISQILNLVFVLRWCE